MILATKYATVNKVPYLGICLGMQISVIEIVRNVLSLERANASEFDDQTPNPVVIFMPEYMETGQAVSLAAAAGMFSSKAKVICTLPWRKSVSKEHVRSLNLLCLQFLH
ncbi:hypothetical protein ACS0TY_001964 [Phlomoides rotata]